MRPALPSPSLAALLLCVAPLSATHAQDMAGAVTSGSAFNPQLSLILTGQYAHDNAGGEGGELIEEAAGILHGTHFDEHGGHAGTGFRLGESELVLSATVDPYFDARFIGTFSSEGEAEVEEAWLQTRLLPAGLKVKAGKFLSDIGYHNVQHPHAWDFDDQNLAYGALLGEHGLADAGVQLTWLAPAPFYLLLGAEALQGNHQERLGTVIDAEDAESVMTATAGALPESDDGPRLVTAFIKAAPDLGDDHALQLGLSLARAGQYQQLLDEDETALSGDELFLDGSQTLYGTDLVYKFDGKGEKGAGDFKLAAEYLRLEKDMAVAATAAAAPLAVGDGVSGEQDGYYVAASYGIAPRWTLGLRHDATGATNELTEAGATTAFGESSRWTAAVGFKPSEFSRIRLQAAKGTITDESGVETELDQVLLTYTLSLGAHGAHPF
ncbi:MAG: porin [Moraxellaceae bacterium]|jgi:hypothetical protein|nr:porin [Moraxellaceae bacterium]